ncbi:RnfABCDGE type electron transport complex subunit G [Lacrimispora saccharolytica]|nr:RnfABCDGE type electron transport complex subunit G [Lacrimispora saccharolytica]
MSKIIKNALALTAITVVIGLLLGVVYEVTKEPIAQQQLKEKQEACVEVFPDADSFEAMDITGNTEDFRAALDEAGYTAQTVDEVYEALDASGETAGYVITVTSAEGYGGDIQFSMGVALDGTTLGISFLSISETAGLGMNADTDSFKDQFKDQNVPEFSYSKTGATQEGEIDALSGATITTNAVTNGVNAGLCVFQLLSEGGIG